MKIAKSCLVTKYQDLVDRSVDINNTIPGITDKIIGSADIANRGPEYKLGAVTGEITDISDMRTIFTQNSKLNTMAEKFALAEYVIVNQLSQSITLGMPNWTGLSIGDIVLDEEVLIFDEHAVGSMGSLLFNTLQYRALSSCLLELVSVLKANDLFSETIINVASEFNRIPNWNRDGSEHGDLSFVLYSGAIKQAYVLGNIESNPVNSGRPEGIGTWGKGAAHTGLDSERIEPNHMLSTLATALRVPASGFLRQSLIKEEEGELKANVPLGKTV